MEKRIIIEAVDNYTNWSYGISIYEIRQYLDALEDDGVTDVKISTGIVPNDEDIVIVTAYKERLETDIEFQNRIQREANTKHLQEQGELKLLAELKAKYEK